MSLFERLERIKAIEDIEKNEDSLKPKTVANNNNFAQVRETALRRVVDELAGELDKMTAGEEGAKNLQVQIQEIVGRALTEEGSLHPGLREPG